MASWRDTASPQAQDDLDGLLGPAIGFAQEQLTQRGEFYPYALVMNAAGEHEMVAADIDADRPASADVITALIETLSARRDQMRAVAVVADTHVPELGGDAIRVTLEHREGAAMAVLLSYTRKRFRGGIDYGQLQGTAAGTVIW